MKNKDLKQEKDRCGRHAGHWCGSYNNFPKIRSDYPNHYFRELGKKEISEQFENKT